jgi:hypothetical protein
MSFFINLNYQQPQLQPQLQQLNPYEVAETFCNSYYTTIITKGYAGVLNLFDPDCYCNYNGSEMIGMYSILSLFASEGIAKMFYDKLCYTPMVINSETLLIQTTGFCQGVTFWGTLGFTHPFVETFILKYTGSGVIVVGYI